MDRRDFLKILISFVGGGLLGTITTTLPKRWGRKEKEKILSGVISGPVRLEKACEFCGGCIALCPTQALELSYPLLRVYQERCIRCRNCEMFCPVGAIKIR